MNNSKFDYGTETAWCPGCGNFNILKSLKQALEETNVEQEKLCLVSGIGQAAKLPQYVNVFAIRVDCS